MIHCSRKSIYFLLISFFTFINLFSQEQEIKENFTDSVIITKNNKRYFKHTVKYQQTLYSIKNFFEIPISIIKNENPQISSNSKLFIGQIIYIPVKKYESKKVLLNGNFIQYKIQKGNTIYSICKEYSITEGELYNANPHIKINGFILGDFINIPIKEIEVPQEVINQISKKEKIQALLTYTVKPKDNFYRISKNFRVSVKALKKANPKIKSLKIGDELTIPQSKKRNKASYSNITIETVTPEKSTQDKVVAFVTKKKENKKIEMNDSLKSVEQSINYNNTFSDLLPDFTKENKDTLNLLLPKLKSSGEFTVSILLPFNYTQYFNDTTNALSRSLFTKINLSNSSKLSIDLTLGILTALDSLKKNNPNISIKFFDTAPSDSQKLDTILKLQKKIKPDFIIGPLFEEELLKVGNFCKKYKIKLITPAKIRNSLLIDNPYFFKSKISNYSQREVSTSFIAKNYINYNILLVSSPNYEKDISRVALLLEQKVKEANNFETIIKTINVKENLEPLFEAISSTKLNLIIVKSENNVFINQLLQNLTSYISSQNISLDSCQILGQYPWLEYESIELSYLNDYKFSTFNNIFVNYSSPEVKTFTKRFYKIHKSFPSEHSILGFDLFNFVYFSSLYQKSKSIDTSDLAIIPHYPIYKGLATTMNFIKINQSDGYENIHTYHLKVENYKIKKLNSKK